MINASPLQLTVLGFVLLVIGFLLPFAMVLHVVESTLLLNFVAYLSSLFGLVLGVVGLALHGRAQKHDGE